RTPYTLLPYPTLFRSRRVEILDVLADRACAALRSRSRWAASAPISQPVSGTVRCAADCTGGPPRSPPGAHGRLGRTAGTPAGKRSEERRVGKDGRAPR